MSQPPFSIDQGSHRHQFHTLRIRHPVDDFFDTTHPLTDDRCCAEGIDDASTTSRPLISTQSGTTTSSPSCPMEFAAPVPESEESDVSVEQSTDQQPWPTHPTEARTGLPRAACSGDDRHHHTPVGLLSSINSYATSTSISCGSSPPLLETPDPSSTGVPVVPPTSATAVAAALPTASEAEPPEVPALGNGGTRSSSAPLILWLPTSSVSTYPGDSVSDPLAFKPTADTRTSVAAACSPVGDHNDGGRVVIPEASLRSLLQHVRRLEPLETLVQQQAVSIAALQREVASLSVQLRKHRRHRPSVGLPHRGIDTPSEERISLTEPHAADSISSGTGRRPVGSRQSSQVAPPPVTVPAGLPPPACHRASTRFDEEAGVGVASSSARRRMSDAATMTDTSAGDARDPDGSPQTPKSRYCDGMTLRTVSRTLTQELTRVILDVQQTQSRVARLESRCEQEVHKRRHLGAAAWRQFRKISGCMKQLKFSYEHVSASVKLRKPLLHAHSSCRSRSSYRDDHVALRGGDVADGAPLRRASSSHDNSGSSPPAALAPLPPPTPVHHYLRSTLSRSQCGMVEGPPTAMGAEVAGAPKAGSCDAFPHSLCSVASPLAPERWKSSVVDSDGGDGGHWSPKRCAGLSQSGTTHPPYDAQARNARATLHPLARQGSLLSPSLGRSSTSLNGTQPWHPAQITRYEEDTLRSSSLSETNLVERGAMRDGEVSADSGGFLPRLVGSPQAPGCTPPQTVGRRSHADPHPPHSGVRMNTTTSDSEGEG